jgi:hypothetical protein
VLHPSTRRHYLPGFPDEDAQLSLAGWTKKVTGVPVIAVGSVGLETEFNPGGPGGPIPPASVEKLLDQFEAGEFDVIAVGRARWPTRTGSIGCATAISTSSPVSMRPPPSPVCIDCGREHSGSTRR